MSLDRAPHPTTGFSPPTDRPDAEPALSALLRGSFLPDWSNLPMSQADYWIDRAGPGDGPAIERLLDRSFGAGRLDKTSYRYRDGVDPVPELDLVARDASGLIGTVRYWPVAIGSGFARALLLGPLAVSPERRGLGIGSALMRRALDFATDAGHNLVVLVGDLAFYREFGFEPATPHGITMANEQPVRVLVKELVPGALAGVSGAITRWGWVRDPAARRDAGGRHA